MQDRPKCILEEPEQSEWRAVEKGELRARLKPKPKPKLSCCRLQQSQCECYEALSQLLLKSSVVLHKLRLLCTMCYVREGAFWLGHAADPELS